MKRRLIRRGKTAAGERFFAIGYLTWFWGGSHGLVFRNCRGLV